MDQISIFSLMHTVESGIYGPYTPYTCSFYHHAVETDRISFSFSFSAPKLQICQFRTGFVLGFLVFRLVSFSVFSFLGQFRFRPSFVFGPSSFSAQSETVGNLRLLQTVLNFCVHSLNRALLRGVSPVG